jgi:hypothetical protein
MDVTSLVVTGATIFIVVLSIVLVAGAFYLILVWLPRYQNKKVENLKASGRKGKGVILRVPESVQKYNSHRKGMYTFVTIGLEIDVPGVGVYQVDKNFTFPTGYLSSLEVGKEVEVWIDPHNPHDHSKIVMHVK